MTSYQSCTNVTCMSDSVYQNFNIKRRKSSSAETNTTIVYSNILMSNARIVEYSCVEICIFGTMMVCALHNPF